MNTNKDTSTRLLTTILALQCLIVINQWISPSVQVARAQVPDAGAQQQDVIRQLQAGNEKLDHLISILESGNLQVRVAKPDDSLKQ